MAAEPAPSRNTARLTNDGLGATAPVPTSRAERPLPVRSSYLRRDGGQRSRRADFGRPAQARNLSDFRSRKLPFQAQQRDGLLSIGIVNVGRGALNEPCCSI